MANKIDNVEVVIPENGYQPTSEEITRQDEIWSAFSVAEYERDQSYPHFNNRTLRKFIDDSQKRFNLYQRPRRNTEDWQAKVVTSIPRNKVMAFLSRLSANRTGAEFFSEDNDDKVRAKIIQALYDKSKEKEKYSMPGFNQMLSAIVKGTVIVFEGYKNVPWNNWNDVYSEIIKLEDFYPGDLRKQNIQDMAHCFWVTYPKWSIFKQEFTESKFPNAKFVLPGSEVRQSTFYSKFDNGHSKDDEVMVLRWFNKVTNTFDILANGVLLTKIDTKLPFQKNVKEGRGLPFWGYRFEPFAEDFFYGNSLTNKLKGESDAFDASLRMNLDQHYLSIHPPILSNMLNEFEDELMVPGRRIPVSGDLSQTRELKISSPDSSAFKMMGLLTQNMNLASADDITQGISGTGNTKTATEVERAREGSLENMSLFLSFQESGIENGAMLRVSNILENYSKPIGRKDGKNVYRKLRVDNMPLLMSQGVGSVIIEFTEKPPKVNMPPEVKKALKDKYGDMVDKISVKVNKVTGLEHVYLTPEALNDFSVGVKIIANSSVRTSKASEKSDEMQFQQTALTFYPELIDKQKGFKKMAEKFNRSHEEYVKEEGEPTPGAPEALGGQGTQPGQGGDMVPATQNVREALGG